MAKQLLFSVTRKDLDITFFSGSGAGGQYRNKHQNCVRIKHRDSGVIVTGQEERSKEQNLRNAFKRLTQHPKFKMWLRVRISEEMADKEKEEQEIQRKVDEAMKEENIRVEFYDPDE
jgi:protein subunit release factor A